jgi:hypothetical protein
MTPLEWLKLKGRERAPTQNNKKTKSEQLKFSKTYPSTRQKIDDS